MEQQKSLQIHLYPGILQDVFCTISSERQTCNGQRTSATPELKILIDGPAD